MADVDINSEILKFLGYIRFIIWCIMRVFIYREYPGTFTAIGQNIQSSRKKINRFDEMKNEVKVGNSFKYLNILNVPWVSKYDMWGCLS